jgi:hypothetical protein
MDKVVRSLNQRLAEHERLAAEHAIYADAMRREYTWAAAHTIEGLSHMVRMAQEGDLQSRIMLERLHKLLGSIAALQITTPNH